MAFNSNSYHRNKAHDQAKEYLDAARVAKDRGLDQSVQHYARLARLQWHMYLSYLRIKRMDDDHRSMSASDFIAKYGSAS